MPFQTEKKFQLIYRKDITVRKTRDHILSRLQPTILFPRFIKFSPPQVGCLFTVQILKEKEKEEEGKNFKVQILILSPRCGHHNQSSDPTDCSRPSPPADCCGPSTSPEHGRKKESMHLSEMTGIPYRCNRS